MESKQNSNTQENPQFVQKLNLPNATVVLVLGIVSIAIGWCFGIIGIALATIGLVLSNKDKLLYQQSPDTYSAASYKNLETGRTCSIIGLIVSAVCFIIEIITFVIIGAAIGGFLHWFDWLNL